MYKSAASRAVKRESGKRPAVQPMYVDAVFIGDKSTSMSTMGTAPRDGIETFMDSYYKYAIKNSSTETFVETVCFNHMGPDENSAHTIYSDLAKNITAQDKAHARSMMIPSGTTRLFDTVISAVMKQQDRVNAFYKCLPREVRALNPEVKVILTLLTDGEDNMSESNADDMKKCIEEHRKDYNAWVVFAAANQDAMKAGARYGFTRNDSLQMGASEEEAQAAFRACTNSSIRGLESGNREFTQQERDESFTYYDEDGYGYDDDIQHQVPYSASSRLRRCGYVSNDTDYSDGEDYYTHVDDRYSPGYDFYESGYTDDLDR